MHVAKRGVMSAKALSSELSCMILLATLACVAFNHVFSNLRFNRQPYAHITPCQWSQKNTHKSCLQLVVHPVYPDRFGETSGYFLHHI